MTLRRQLAGLAFAMLTLLTFAASAEVLAPPGDLRIRHDIELLNDTRAIDITATAWPISWGEIQSALGAADKATLTPEQRAAFDRLLGQSRDALETNFLTVDLEISVGDNARIIRTFEDTPREDIQLAAKVSWAGERFAFNIEGTAVTDPIDGDEFRPDGTYVGVALGNWMLTAGWQDRWWGPGRDGSIILGHNHRPPPGITLQRNNSTPFETKWLSWLGPWTLTTFMAWLDDERVVEDALLFGFRGSFRPVKGLEIGLSRTAQWCGQDRPCDLKTFANLLLGRDNAGVNVDPEDEPGNQLGGIDIRWSLPNSIPATVYLQWIGEDGRPNGGLVGNWSRQLGAELHGQLGSLSHRTHFEVSDTLARQGGSGFSEIRANYTYEHYIYQTGYRYKDRSIGHGMDGDGLSYSLGSTLVQSAGHVWNVLLRYMEINREGSPQPTHTLSPRAQELTDILVTHERYTKFGRFKVGAGYARLDDKTSGVETSDATYFIQWSSR